MKINIVLWKDAHILPRMSGWLAEHNGWTISDDPDPNADVNYFMPYLMWDLKIHPNTLTSGWFTHYEQGTTWKMEKWQDAATFIDAPLVTAPMYCDILDRAQVITPGIDRDRFVPIKHDVGEKPVVGTAGVGQPRKGPKLIIDLFYANIPLELNIAGAAWPFAHTVVANKIMPKWYANLDVYICTSSIEGIPAPVLEALSCDVKIVIPNGVGICDQLPEMEGIRHYQKNNGADMIRAINQVLDDKPSEGSLRDVTSGYAIDDWCYSNKLAMEALLDANISV